MKPTIKQIEICADRIVLTDTESIKFEYIHRFIQVSPSVLVLVCFGTTDPFGEFVVADNHLSIILSFTGVSRFVKDTRTAILKYKKLNIYNKSVKGFRYFKL